MKIINISIQKQKMIVDAPFEVVAGTIGLYGVQVEYDEEWDEIPYKLLMLKGTKTIKLEEKGEIVNVPGEVISDSCCLEFGLIGFDGNGDVRITTYSHYGSSMIWVKSSDWSGDVESDEVETPTPTIWEDIKREIGEIKDKVEKIEDEVENLVPGQPGCGESITVDDELNIWSENPVQNRVVTQKFNKLDEDVAKLGRKVNESNVTSEKITTALGYTPANQEDVGRLSEEIDDLSETTDEGGNLLNPIMLGTGTVQNVTIVREEDAFIYNGTATKTESLSGSDIVNVLEPGKTYTVKIFSESTKEINASVRFYESGVETGMILFNNGNWQDSINTPYTFKVPSEATKVEIKIGVLSGVSYSDDAYKFVVVEGEYDSSYIKYGENLTAIDRVARSGIGAIKATISDIKSELHEEIDALTEMSDKNILDPAMLGIGTVGNVVVSRNNDVFTFTGTAPKTDSLSGINIVEVLEPGKTYTAKIFSESVKEVNASIRFYKDLSTTSLGMVLMYNSNSKNSLNTPYTFTVPAEANIVQIKIGVFSGVIYNNETYTFGVAEGSSDFEYHKYGEKIVVDAVAREEIEMLKNVSGFVCHVSPSGSDSNNGTESHPFATIQHAVDSGYSRIILASGEYKNQIVNISGKNGLKIICNTTNKENNLYESQKRQAKAKFDNSIDVTGLTAHNAIVRTALTVDEDSSFHKVFIEKSLELQYSGSGYYGRTTAYNAVLWEITDDILTCTRLKPVLTVAECEVEQGTFTFDGTYLYVNPTGGSADGKTYKRLNVDTNEINNSGFYLYNCTDVEIQGVDFMFFPYFNFRTNKVNGLKMRDCDFSFTCYGAASQFVFTNGELHHCKAAHAGADGYNITSGGNVSFYDCDATNCYDDGISHHDETEGIIDGGEWSYCYKGGVTPSYGSNVTVKNVVAHNNRMYGIYYVQGDNRITDKKQIMQNCLAYDNTLKDICIKGYDVISSNCIYQTKEVTGTFTEYGSEIIS